MRKDIGIVLYDAMRINDEKRPCEMYRELICPTCNSPKSCNDLDVIMCAVAYLVSHSFESEGNGKG